MPTLRPVCDRHRAARGGGLWQDLADAARSSTVTEREAVRRAQLEERLERQKEDRAGGSRQGLMGGLQASPPRVGPLTFLALGISADA